MERDNIEYHDYVDYNLDSFIKFLIYSVNLYEYHDYDNDMLNSFIYFLINSVLHKDQIVEYAQSRIISYLYTSYWLMCSITNRWEGNRNKCAYTSNLIVYIFR